MRSTAPKWLPPGLQKALSEPTMSIPDAGKALFRADRARSYLLARRGEIPVIQAGRRREVPTVWVRQQLMLDDEPPKAA